ncbi:glycosyltransferase family 1 protein [Cetobacterium sp.]|uniref:glycosyltransferase family 4 protein n=1 Tax=Cetobacterium sp. TaxID=2071632 RepID=UPI0025BC33FF|nr:glycosyltransferase family 1 protein [Cetobacterium sp.]
MKIAIDCRMYNSSGIGTYIREILPYMIETENEFLLIGKKSELEEYENLMNIEIQECDIPIFSPKEVFFFPIKKINKCDIFYTPNYNIPGGIKVPIYSTIHDVIFLDMPELTSKLGGLIRKIFYKRAYYLSKTIFTVSNFSKKRIEYHLGNKKDIVITYNGVSKHILEDDGAVYKKKDYIIFVGNIKKHKGLKTLLLAYKEAKKEGLTSGLVIVGNQNNFKTKDSEIIEILEKSEDEGIIFTGYVNNKELKKLIAEAKVLVQPSLYEGFGIPPLEALVLGTSIVVSDIEVFKEIYNNLDIEFFEVNNWKKLKELLKMNERIKSCSNLKNKQIRFTYKECSEKIKRKIFNG